MSTELNYYQLHKEEILQKRKLRKLDFKARRRDHLAVARWRANRDGRPFEITLEDIEWPSHCPVLGIELDYFATKRSDNSPSLDRIDNSLGYTKENTWVISNRANRVKSDSSLEELKTLVRVMEEKLLT